MLFVKTYSDTSVFTGYIFQVNLFDFGFTITVVELSKLRAIRDEDESILADPPKCFRCRMAHLQLSAMSATGTWPHEANTKFREWTIGKKLTIEVRCLPLHILYNSYNLIESLWIAGVFGGQRRGHCLRYLKYRGHSQFQLDRNGLWWICRGKLHFKGESSAFASQMRR